nr:zinc finger, CCHC-type, retrotransposon Gag domain protein [Tanacetum cinerariifolium]
MVADVVVVATGMVTAAAMVNTRQSTPEFLGPAFDEVVQRAVNALLPGLLPFTPGWKARLASYKFEGDALSWWNALKQAKGGEAYVATLSWKVTFKATFHSRRISCRYDGRSTYYGGIVTCTHQGLCRGNCVPPILAEQFELKHSLINMTTLDHAVTTAMTAILKQFQSTPPSASVKAVEEICVTCSGAHPYYQCLAADGNIFLELRDNIQGYVAAAAVNYNQGHLPSNTISSPKGALKAITTRSGIVLDGPSIPIPPPFINPEEDERVEETLTDQDLVEYTIKALPPLVQKPKPPSQRNFVVHQRDPL